MTANKFTTAAFNPYDKQHLDDIFRPYDTNQRGSRLQNCLAMLRLLDIYASARQPF